MVVMELSAMLGGADDRTDGARPGLPSSAPDLDFTVGCTRKRNLYLDE